MSMRVHCMTGCSPTPLASYLKALGVLRLVVEQGADEKARGWWQDEHFRLMTVLTRDELEQFFLARYEPTPLLSPWNKGCGFFKANDPALGPLERTTAKRFQRFRLGIAQARALLDAITEADALIRAIKARTKTNKAFQTTEQREILRGSAMFRSYMEQLQGEIARLAGSASPNAEALTELAELQGLVEEASSPPSSAEAERLKNSPAYRRVLASADRRFKELKAALVPDCRRNWRGPLAGWLSAAVVLGEDGDPEWPSLLGTGGNDGNLDFTNNFMQRIGELFVVASNEGGPTPGGIELLGNALWGEVSNHLGVSAVGQFHPGAAGGANSTTGALGDSLINAWDFVLMMEGSLLFRTRTARRLDPNSSSRAVAPFVVRSHGVGFATSGTEKAQRGEQWMPLWSHPATLTDVACLFSEGRVQLGRQTANRPIDVARAVARLGVARGIEAFARYGYLERNGQSTLAVPLGRLEVRQSERARLVDNLAPWMDRLRRVAAGKSAPARLVQAEKRLADAVMAALAHDESMERWQLILSAAAAIEQLQATGCGIEAGPIPALSPDWIDVLGATPEVRLALSLGSAAASYKSSGRPVDPIRHHWLPLEPGARRFLISDRHLSRDARVVMFGRDPVADCAAVVERRLLEAGRRSQRILPLVAARGHDARLSDMSALLRGEINLEKIMDLARALMAVKWDAAPRGHGSATPGRSGELPHEAWLAVRLACLPWPLESGRIIPAEPTVVRRLIAGDSAGAIGVALGRLRSAGLRVPLRSGVTSPVSARLWAAALAFPIDRRSALHAACVLDPNLKGVSNA